MSTGNFPHVFVWTRVCVSTLCPMVERFPNGTHLLEGCSKASLLLPWLLLFLSLHDTGFSPGINSFSREESSGKLDIPQAIH